MPWDQIIAPVIDVLRGYGLAGIVIVWLGYANRLLNSRIDNQAKSIDAIQERRSAEREKNAEVMAGAAAAQIKMSEAVKVLSDKVEDLAKEISVFNAESRARGRRQ